MSTTPRLKPGGLDAGQGLVVIPSLVLAAVPQGRLTRRQADESHWRAGGDRPLS